MRRAFRRRARTGAPEDGRIRLPWTNSGRPVARVFVQPLQRFLALEQSSAILLLIATVAALAWANGPWSASYHRTWSTVLGLRLGSLRVAEPLSTWIDEPLLGLFFLVVSLELKREVLTGELRDRRALAVPVVAALAGMALPALIFAALTAGGSGVKGWAIPMATDVPFALGLLALAGRGLPPSVRPFLLTLAIADDIASLVIIGVFYKGAIDPIPAAVMLGGLAVLWGTFRLRLQAVPIHIAVGAVTLVAAMRSGVHASLAGFAIGLLVPATPFQRPAAVSAEAHRVADETVDDPEPPDADAAAWLGLAGLSRQAVSPLTRLEAALHPWTSNAIVPLFALANAGVTVTGGRLWATLTGAVCVGIIVGRVVGKLMGLPTGALAAVGFRPSRLPGHIRPGHLLGLGGAAGVGFTVPLLVVELALPQGVLADQARLGLLVGTALSALLGAVLMARAGRGEPREP